MEDDVNYDPSDKLKHEESHEWGEHIPIALYINRNPQPLKKLAVLEKGPLVSKN